jgi:hypothetical protein
MRARITLAFVVASVAVSAPALAQTPAAAPVAQTPVAAPVAQTPSAWLGSPGQLILGADRLFGLSFGTLKTEDGTTANTSTQSTTNINTFFSPMPTTVYEIPRLTCDYIVVAGLTLGGSFGVFARSGTNKTEVGGVSTERDAPSATVFQFAPRVGYALPIIDRIAFWPRAGITYYWAKAENTTTGVNPTTTKTSTDGFGMNLEAMFAFSLIPGFAVTAGPVLDLPLSGSRHTETTGVPVQPDDKVRQTNWGLALGLIGYF